MTSIFAADTSAGSSTVRTMSDRRRSIGWFELIGEIAQDGVIVLVAIKLRLDGRGRHIVASTYPIDRNTLDRRLRKGFAKPA